MTKPTRLARDFQKINEHIEDQLLAVFGANQEQGNKTWPEQSSDGIDSSGNASKPKVALNTRIPKQVSDQLDDLIYFAKKRGKTLTKQSLVVRSLNLLLDSMQTQTS